jgi:membrane protein
MLDDIKNKLSNVFFIKQFTKLTKEKSLPGFNGVSIYLVGYFFKETMSKGTLNTKASSLAYNFFLAIFPAILFLFSLIPFIPLEDILHTILLQIETALPQSIKPAIMDTLNDLIDNERQSFLLLNIILTLYFASNGIVNLMVQFNNTHLFKESRSWWKQRLLAIALVLIITVLVLTAVILITFTKIATDYAIEQGILNSSVNWVLINITRWITVFALFYFAISFLYYLGPAKTKSWKFFSAGSSVATILIITSSLVFSFYISNFSQYNAIYGSIGTIMILMLYFHLNSYILLLGFELNASIRKGESKTNSELNK